MTTKKGSPFACNMFVCFNERHDKPESCRDGINPAIRKKMKKDVADRGRSPQVKVSRFGCMGLCADGPNVVLYPRQIRFGDNSLGDMSSLLSAVDGILNSISLN